MSSFTSTSTLACVPKKKSRLRRISLFASLSERSSRWRLLSGESSSAAWSSFWRLFISITSNMAAVMTEMKRLRMTYAVTTVYV